MKKRFLIFYLLVCIAFPLQAGKNWRSLRGIFRSAAERASAENVGKVSADIAKASAKSVGSTPLKEFENIASVVGEGMDASLIPAQTQSLTTGIPPAVTPFVNGTMPSMATIGENIPQNITSGSQVIQPLGINVPDFSSSSVITTFKTLKALADELYNDAVQAVEESPNPPIMGEPINIGKGLSPFYMKSKEIYPQEKYLHKKPLSSVLANYHYVIQSNRSFIEQLKKESEEFWPAFNAATNRFYEEVEAMGKQPDESKLVEWASAQIPADTKVLGIGELHGYREIPLFVRDLLENLLAREDMKGRKIILFTEFLADHNTPGYLHGGAVSCPYGYYYTPLWNQARKWSPDLFELVGLEPRYVKEDITTVRAYAGGDETFSLQKWAAPEGVRLRNEHWLDIMAKYRQKDPDALFIIYAGSGHLLYPYPDSLLTQLGKEGTFMLNVIPDEAYVKGKIYYDTDPLEEFNPRLSFPQPAIKWQSPDLIYLSGYDARVRLPIDIEVKKADIAHWEAKFQ